MTQHCSLQGNPPSQNRKAGGTGLLRVTRHQADMMGYLWDACGPRCVTYGGKAFWLGRLMRLQVMKTFLQKMLVCHHLQTRRWGRKGK